MKKGLKFRHELKYFINWHEYLYLRSRLNAVMATDKNAKAGGSYFIRSLYFDDMYDTAYHDKIDGYEHRKKYRIRFYNYNQDFLRFECKYKVGNMVSKETRRVTKAFCDRFIEKDSSFLLDINDMFYKNLYIEQKMKLLEPVVVVDYDREAYIFDAGNVRITFDKHLRAGVASTDMFDSNLVTKQIFDEPVMILEIKYDEYLPSQIRNLVQICSHDISSISKYILCRDENIKNHFISKGAF